MAISYVATASNIAYRNPGSFVVNKPTGTVEGDTMISTITMFDGTALSLPSGWTQIALVDNASNNLRTYMFYKLAGSSEPSTYTYSLDSADLAAGVSISTYRGVDIANPVGNSAVAQSTTAESLANASLNVTTANSWLVGISSCRHSGTSSCTCSAASMTERVDSFGADTVGSFTRAHATYDSNGTVATGGTTRTFVRTGTTSAHNVILAFLQPELDTPKSSSDTASGVDAQSIVATRTQTDTGSGVEGGANIRTSVTGDTGTGTSAQSLAVSFTKADTGSGTDSGSITAAVSGSETGSGTSAQSIAASLTGGDTGGGADDGNPTGGTTPQDNDNGGFTETFISFVTFTGTDTGSFTENQVVAVPPVPVEPGQFDKTLVMGPAALYIGAYGAVEPNLSAVGNIPDPLVWTDLGGTLGGVELEVEQQFKTIIFEQMPDTPFNRLEKRYLTIKTPLAEATLANLGVALNDTAGVTGTVYTPTVYDPATQLVYRSLIVDGWAPGMTAFNRHKRRRIIVRKCLSIDNVTLSYTKDGQTVYNVTWSCHHVDGSTAPFRIIDEA